jgi:hypothetical protein
MRNPVWVRIAHDRRAKDRLEIGPCPRCGDRNSAVRTRTELAVYLACSSGHMWSLTKPRMMQPPTSHRKEAS